MQRTKFVEARTTIEDLFHMAKKHLENSGYTIAIETQNHGKDGGGKVVKFYTQKKSQQESGTVETQVFYGNPTQAKIYLNGLIDVFTKFDTVSRLNEVPVKADKNYFDTQSEAVEYARTTANLIYYRVQELEMMHYQNITVGQTTRYHLELSTHNKLEPEMLHIILYKMESGKYELTYYIN